MVPGAGSGRESFPTQGRGHRQLPPRDTLRLQSVLERGSGGVPRIYPALPTGAPLSSWSRLHCRGPRLRSAAPTPTEQLPPDRALLGRPPHPCRPPRDRSASSRRTDRGRALPRLEWLSVDDCEDLDFCRLTVIITCSCTRCLPDVPVFIFWSDGKASVELSWSWKHS